MIIKTTRDIEIEFFGINDLGYIQCMNNSKDKRWVEVDDMIKRLRKSKSYDCEVIINELSIKPTKVKE